VTTTRLATTDDIPALARLINAAYEVERFFLRGDRTNERALQSKLEMPEGCFLLIDGPNPDGLAGAVFVELRGSRGYFGLLSVAPDRQGEGLGRVLVEAAEAHCRAAGCDALDMDVVNLRLELPAFYEKLGFRPVATAPFPAPDELTRSAHLIVMSKSLV
jgi:GNAT superfamily N-acetyltransferase